MNSFSLLKFGAICQTVQSIVPRLSNLLSGSNPGVIVRNMHHLCERENCNLIPHTLTKNNKSLLSQPILPVINLVSGLKIKGRLQLRCEHCYIVARHERWYVMCRKSPRHKQVLMKKREYKTWILTHATQSKIRPW